MPQRRGGEPFGPQRHFRVAWIVEVEKLGDALAAALGGRRDPPTPRHSRMALERRGLHRREARSASVAFAVGERASGGSLK